MNKYMRIIVWFDLPVKTAKERQQATKFRNFLLKDGFFMMQWSVYSRLCNGMDSVNIHKNRVKEQLPDKGAVRLLVLTEKQYENIEILLGDPKFEDLERNTDSVEIF